MNKLLPSPAQILAFALLGILASACSASALEDAAIASAENLAATYIAQTEAVTPTPTATPVPTDTTTPTPTATPTQTPTLTPTTRPTLGSSEFYINIYLIGANANGPVGCGEDIRALSTGVLPSGDPATDVQVALQALFNLRVQYQYGTYNPLYTSSVIISSVQYEDEFGEIVARLTGHVDRGEKGCTWDQIRTVVNTTARKAAGGQSVEVRFNQHAFNDYVSSDR